MPTRIRVTSPKQKRIQVSSATEPKIDGGVIAQMLGAEPLTARLKAKMTPISLATLRSELFRRLQSSGGRPALADATKRVKIPMAQEQWDELEELAVALSSDGYTPTAGQVASTLLSLSMNDVRKQLVAANGK